MLTLESGETLELSAIPAGASVLCPVHLDHRPSAFVVESQRGTRGVHCRTCQSTFWQADPGDYDFDAFDRLFTEKQRQEANAIEEQVEKSDNYLLRLFPPAPEINLFQRRYLGPLTYEPGITIVKSPKGSGKTEALGWLIGEIKGPSAPNGFQKMKHGRDRPKSFLLIGHRVTLINEAARRLGLQSYQDSEPTRYYVVCVNSLAFKRFDFTYDVVIIDESEQVFRHVTSDIVNDIPGGQARCFAEMKHHIAEAKSVARCRHELDHNASAAGPTGIISVESSTTSRCLWKGTGKC